MKVVVAVNLGSIHHGYFSKHLKANKKRRVRIKIFKAFKFWKRLNLKYDYEATQDV